jgi:hypothetical protein
VKGVYRELEFVGNERIREKEKESKREQNRTNKNDVQVVKYIQNTTKV